MIVVDGAALVDALTGADGSERLSLALAGEELHAPALVDFELVSALRGPTLAGRISAARAEDALTDFDDLSLRRWPASDALRGGRSASATTSAPTTRPPSHSPKRCRAGC